MQPQHALQLCVRTQPMRVATLEFFKSDIDLRLHNIDFVKAGGAHVLQTLGLVLDALYAVIQPQHLKWRTGKSVKISTNSRYNL